MLSGHTFSQSIAEADVGRQAEKSFRGGKFGVPVMLELWGINGGVALVGLLQMR